MSRRFRLPILASLTLSFFVVGPVAAAGATVERERLTETNDCQEDIHTDPETGEQTVIRFCSSGHWVITTVMTPGGVEVSSGSVRTTSTVHVDGVLTQENSITDRFTNVTRAGFEQVVHQRFVAVGQLAGSEPITCELTYHLANGEIRHGQQVLICDGEEPGGGEG